MGSREMGEEMLVGEEKRRAREVGEVSTRWWRGRGFFRLREEGESKKWWREAWARLMAATGR